MMNIKRICVLMLAVIFVLGSVAMAADERIMFGEVSVESDGTTTTIEIELLSKPVGKSAVLIATYTDPESGKILSVGINPQSDISLLDGDIFSVSLDDKTEEGGVLSYNVWDSLGGNMSLLNNAPSVPVEAVADETYKDATLGWTAPLDDYDNSDTLTYNIYDDGMLVAENYDSVEYLAENLASDTSYNFEVKAVDSEGVESEGVVIKAETLGTHTAYTTDEYTQSPDMNFEFAGSLTENTRLFYVTKAEAGGLDCYATTTRHNGAPTYLMYRFTNDYFAELEGVKAVALELTYFDEGTDTIKIEVRVTNASGNGMDKEVAIRRTNTGVWKTVRKIYTLPANTHFAYNDDLGNGHYTFRMKADTVGLKVCKFSVNPIFDTEGKTDEYYTIKKNAGSYFTADNAIIECDLTTNAAGTELTEISGRMGVALSGLSGSEATFKVTDSTLMAGNVKVIVTYYAPGEDTTISLNGEEMNAFEGGKWQKAAFDITNIGSGTNAITSNDDIVINSIRVVAAD